MIALGTLESSLINTFVSFKMSFQVAFDRKSFATELTIEGFFFGVDPLMLLDLKRKNVKDNLAGDYTWAGNRKLLEQNLQLNFFSIPVSTGS